MITKRRLILGLTGLLILDMLVLAWMLWLLSQGPESDPSGALGEWVRLVAFLSFPVIVLSLAVVLELGGWRVFRRRRRDQRRRMA